MPKETFSVSVCVYDFLKMHSIIFLKIFPFFWLAIQNTFSSVNLTLSCIMLKNRQTYFKNLAVFTSCLFLTLCMKRLIIRGL